MMPRSIWFVTAGENHILDGDDARLMRTGQLATRLAREGHLVHWWASAFDHSRRTMRSGSTTTLAVSTTLRCTLLWGGGYTRNISLRRIIDHARLAFEFQRLARTEARPDVIVASMPTVELAYAAVRYGCGVGVPTVVDIRDFWPEIFAEAVPKPLAPMATFALRPYLGMRNYAVRHASVVTGISDAAVDWACSASGRPRKVGDRAHVLAYDASGSGLAPNSSTHRSDQFGESAFVVAFVGTMSKRLDLETVIRAAKALHEAAPGQFEFVLAGRGEMEATLATLVQECDVPNVHFLGWLDRVAISELLRNASVGLLPYPSTDDFTRSYPNKFGEYLSAGVAVVTSLTGLVAEKLAANDCGWVYPYRDHEALARSLIAARADRVRLRGMSNRARSLFAREFDSKVVYRAYSDTILALACQSPHAGRD